MKKAIFVLLCLILCGCTITNKEYTKEKHYLGYLQDEDDKMVLPLNTDCYLTVVNKDLKDQMIKVTTDTLFKCHKLLDSHKYYKDDNGNRITNLKVINESFNTEIIVDEILFNAIKEATQITKLTKGYFNLTIGKVSDLYDGKFSSVDSINKDPDNEALNKALASVVPYEKLDEHIILNDSNKSITLIPYNDNEFKIDLGAFSKGYVSDLIYNELLKFNSSFMLNLGSSSIITFNNQDENIEWNVGVINPDKKNESLYAVKLDNLALSTSGDYEQYYLLDDGTRRHHILNPFTGRSENYYREIVLTSNSKAGVIDALTTALFNVEDINTAINLIKEIQNHFDIKINYCFVKDGYKLITNKESKELFIDSYTSNEVNSIEVIE